MSYTLNNPYIVARFSRCACQRCAADKLEKLTDDILICELNKHLHKLFLIEHWGENDECLSSEKASGILWPRTSTRVPPAMGPSDGVTDVTRGTECFVF